MDTYAVIRGVSFFAPQRIMTETSTSDLGTQAAKNLLAKEGLGPQDLDLIIAASLSPDYFFPGIGVQIQHKLGTNFIPAIDIRGQNSGFAWSLASADAFIRSGLYRRVLVVGAELFSRLLQSAPSAKKMAALVGDGAGAVILEAQMSEKEKPQASNQVRGLIDHVLGSDGRGLDIHAMKRPGCGRGNATLVTAQDIQSDAHIPIFDELAFKQNAVEHMVASAQTILQRNKITVDDLDLLISSSMDKSLNDSVCKKLNLATEKFFQNNQNHGDTIAALLPMSMAEAEENGRLKKGNLVLTLTFGSGLNWGANLIRW